MKLYPLAICMLCFTCFLGFAQNKQAGFTTPFEASNGKETATYAEAVAFYKKLAQAYKSVSIQTIGKADGGGDLYVVYYQSKTSRILPGYWFWDKEKDVVILINNAIHPGEPDGVDACMMLVRDAATGKIQIPENIVLAVIPVYNIGGAENRSCCSRANQNGPLMYGFRGNAKNLDLNRDFIKLDANETICLEKLFTYLDPDIFIDNHVSDGADYQHTMTLLATQHDKLGSAVGNYLYKEFTPAIYKDMKIRGYDVVPYVNDFENTPDHGWKEFLDGPRFSSGYAALFQTLAYVPETHMLKSFDKRVAATYALMQSMVKVASTNASAIKDARQKDRDALLAQKIFPLDWKVDMSQCDSVLFSGYAGLNKPSGISSLPRLYYDHDKPFTQNVPFYNHFLPTKTVDAPKAYIIPKTWDRVLAVLADKGVRMQMLTNDTTIKVTAYQIANYETVGKPYESHYLHKNIQVTPKTISIQFKQGDYIISTNQPTKRYLIETLEPTAPDAFLAWNYFDGILQQKEYYSDYVFEDVAKILLVQDSFLKLAFDQKRMQDTTFAKDAAAQLDFVYRHSKYYEPTYLQYPVFRVEE